MKREACSVALVAVLVVVLALVFPRLALPSTYWPDDDWPALDELASRVAGVHVDVRCQAIGETSYLGVDDGTAIVDRAGSRMLGATLFFADGRRGPVVLSSRACAGALLALVDPAGTYPLAPADELELAGVGLFVLLHETGHVVNGRNEGAADCFALEREERVARELGASAVRAFKLADVGRRLHAAQAATYHEGCP